MSEEYLQKAKQTSNRAIITKLMKESDNTKKEQQEHGLPLDSSSTSRLHTIYAMLKGKISTANALDEQFCLYVVEQRILRCKLKFYVKPMKNPLGISTSRGNQGTTQGKKKYSFDLGWNRTHDLRIGSTIALWTKL